MARLKQRDASDVCVTAIEGGINYWAHGCAYLKRRPMSLQNNNLEEFVKNIKGIEFIESEGEKKFSISCAQIVKAAQRIVDENLTNAAIRRYIVEDDIDADAADCIVQVAAFGKLVYG